jgi:hypothetical protein
VGYGRARTARRSAGYDRAAPPSDDHPVLRLQQLAGNTAVQRLLTRLPVQRQLKVTGARGDIATMLGLLGAPTGLRLTRDPKTTAVNGTPSGRKPTAPALLTALAPILADPEQHAEINLGRTQPGVWMGQAPGDDAAPLVQELRIDQIAALEKHAPGDGVANLAHEIVENFVGHGQHAAGSGFDFATSHEAALKTENAVLGELQAAQKIPLSGARQNTYKVLTGTGARQELWMIEARDNDFLIAMTRFGGQGEITGARRVPRQFVRSFAIAGFTGRSTAVPTTAVTTIADVAALLNKDPTLCLVLRGTAAKPNTTKTASGWVDLVFAAIEAAAGTQHVSSVWERTYRESVLGTTDDVRIVLDWPKV